MGKRVIASIFRPKGGTWKSIRLKHWYGKRIKYRGHYVKIVSTKMDWDLNFICWIVRTKNGLREIKDPNYRSKKDLTNI